MVVDSRTYQAALKRIDELLREADEREAHIKELELGRSELQARVRSLRSEMSHALNHLADIGEILAGEVDGG